MTLIDKEIKYYFASLLPRITNDTRKAEILYFDTNLAIYKVFTLLLPSDALTNYHS